MFSFLIITRIYLKSIISITGFSDFFCLREMVSLYHGTTVKIKVVDVFIKRWMPQNKIPIFSVLAVYQIAVTLVG